MNKYNNKYRKYERLNENITDKFAIEAREKLHSKGIYIIEDKKHIISDIYEDNTNGITKLMLTPFINKYRENIIKVMLEGDIEQLYKIVGKENFEQLNDVINKVDYLVSKGLRSGLKDTNPLVQEYYKEAEKLEKIYINMEKYKTKNEKVLDER